MFNFPSKNEKINCTLSLPLLAPHILDLTTVQIKCNRAVHLRSPPPHDPHHLNLSSQTRMRTQLQHPGTQIAAQVLARRVRAEPARPEFDRHVHLLGVPCLGSPSFDGYPFPDRTVGIEDADRGTVLEPVWPKVGVPYRDVGH